MPVEMVVFCNQIPPGSINGINYFVINNLNRTRALLQTAYYRRSTPPQPTTFPPLLAQVKDLPSRRHFNALLYTLSATQSQTLISSRNVISVSPSQPTWDTTQLQNHILDGRTTKATSRRTNSCIWYCSSTPLSSHNLFLPFQCHPQPILNLAPNLSSTWTPTRRHG